jgi:hypothetical protein
MFFAAKDLIYNSSESGSTASAAVGNYQHTAMGGNLPAAPERRD